MVRTVSRRCILKTGASAAALTCAVPLLRRTRSCAARPNILVLVVDDLRHDAVGYQNAKVHTPNLDRLARDGVRFHNAFVTTAICAISRASIFTGMYARRHGICDFMTPRSLEQLRGTYPDLLGDAGYRTGFFGKYGVGDLKVDGSGKTIDAQLPEADRAAFDVIEDYGFAYFVEQNGEGEPESYIHAVLAENAERFIQSNPPRQPFCLSLSFVSPHESSPKVSWTEQRTVAEAMPAEREALALYENERFPDGALTSDAAFQSLSPFLRESLARELWSVHFADPTRRLEYLRRYYALVTGIDGVIGRVLQALEKAGALSDTVILFTSDNGYLLGDYQLHGKWFGYESSIRVPLMIRPAGGPVSRDISVTALNVDLAPTVLALAGVPIPQEMQGRDLSALWTGARSRPWRTDFLYEHFTWHCGRTRGSPAEKATPSSEGVRNDRYTYLRYPYQDGEERETLFDRQSDPQQLKNVIGSADRDLVERLRSRTDALIAELGPFAKVRAADAGTAGLRRKR